MISRFAAILSPVLAGSLVFAGQDANSIPDFAYKFSKPAQIVAAGLVAGNKRFVANKPTHPMSGPDRRAEVSKGQKPDTIVLCCSDSRVPPEIVFDQGLGNLFVVRTAGEALDSAGVASIEYAVAHFHPKLLLVMGHDYCGAINATLSTPKGKSAGSPDLDRLVASLRPHLKGMSKGDDPSLLKPVRANVIATARELFRRSAIIRKSMQAMQMFFVRGVYRLKTGALDFW